MNIIETMEILKSKNWLGHTHSDHVCKRYSEFVATGKYPYLREVVDFIVTQDKLCLSELEQKNLESLVYCSANEYRATKEKSEGWVLCSDQFLIENEGKKIEIKTDGIFGSGVIVASVRRIGDKLYVMKPKARNRHYLLYDLKVRAKKS